MFCTRPVGRSQCRSFAKGVFFWESNLVVDSRSGSAENCDVTSEELASVLCSHDDVRVVARSFPTALEQCPLPPTGRGNCVKDFEPKWGCRILLRHAQSSAEGCSTE